MASFSSLSILEQFYGEELSRALLSKIRATPSDQLAELADRLVQHGKSVDLSLLHRSGRRQIDHALGEEIPLPPPLLESFTRGPLSVYDDLFLAPFNSKPSSRRGALKHALLYSERLLLPDRALDWGHELLLQAGLPDGLQDDGQAGGDLADLLIEYLPLMELMRRDEVLLASNSYVNLSSDPADYEGLFWFIEGDIRSPESDSDIFATDPYLAWVVVNRVGSLESWELDAYGRNTIETLVGAAGDILRNTAIYPETRQRLREVVRLAHGPTASVEDVRRAIILNLLYGRANVYPLTSNEVVRTHLVRSSVALLEGAATTELDRYNAIADAITYEMPDLIDVSLSDVVKLRQDEDVFADVRSALTELAESTSTADRRSYAHYHRDVRDRAEDLVRPKFENFTKVAFRKKLLSAATSFATGKMVRLGINSLASLTGGVAHPVTDPLARAADKATRSLVNQRMAKSGSAREIAKTILLSVLQ